MKLTHTHRTILVYTTKLFFFLIIFKGPQCSLQEPRGAMQRTLQHPRLSGLWMAGMRRDRTRAEIKPTWYFKEALINFVIFKLFIQT